jgi:hypothetical protein
MNFIRTIHKEKYILFTLFISFLLLYTSSPNYTSFDSRWSIPQGVSILKEGNLNLIEYLETIKLNNYYAIIVKSNSEVYDLYPKGTVYLSLPFLLFMRSFFSFEDIVINFIIHENLISSIILSLSISFIYLISRKYLGIFKSFLLVAIIGLGTSYLSILSRALWQQTGAVFFISLTLLNLVYIKENSKKRYFLSIGIWLAMCYISRPLTFLWILIILIYMIKFYRDKFYLIILSSSVFAILFFVINYITFGELFPYYYRYGSTFVYNNILLGFWGQLVSPSRGIFIWSSFLIFIFFRKANYKDNVEKNNFLEKLFIANIVLHVLILSLNPNWWGGHSVGPRLMAETIPLFGFLLIKPIYSLNFRRRPIFSLLFAILIILSVIIHMVTAFNNGSITWNIYPVNVDEFPSRNWDFYDSQFLREIPTWRSLLR